MNAPDRKVRVFISSTFRDMHAERDHLVTVVFPELRERCERLGLEFFDVDLRWGVPEKTQGAGTANLEEANSWEYCRKWIDRVQPFFVCLLGQRYGWVPPPEKLKQPEDAERQRRAPRSITDMEVRYAVLDEPEQKRLSFFYLRDPVVPRPAATAPRATWQIYSDYVDGQFEGDHFIEDAIAADKLTKFKQAVTACGRPARLYSDCEWKDDHFTKMESFGQAVLEDLWSGILRDSRYVSEEAWRQVLGDGFKSDLRYADPSHHVPDDLAEKLVPLAKPPPKTPLEAEREQMQRFADSRLQWFQGREKELGELLQFITDPAEAHDTPRLALIAAQPGQGKSALMAKLWDEMQGRALGPPSANSDARRVEDNEPYVIAHFVGATEKSCTAYHLVKRLNDELDASDITFPERPTPEGQTKEEPKLDFQSLCHRLWDRLGDYAGEKRIVIILDALNQLDDGHELGWLPYRLGSSVRIVVSCIEEADKKMGGKNKDSENFSANHFSASNSSDSPAGKVLAALDSRYPKPKRIPLGPLTAEDIRVIVTEYLAECCKELDAPHVDALCALPQARNPLYLLVMLAELRTLGGNDMNRHVPALIAGMGTQHPDTVSLFHWVLQRLEQAEGFGVQAVRSWCLYLALGRVGMSSRELSDLLIRKLGPDSAATAQRIERALRRYLQRRGEQWDFFHGQLRQAVMERGGEIPGVKGHHDIANHFQTIADPAGDKTWTGRNSRALLELPFHLMRADAWANLIGDHANPGVLTDLRFIGAKCTAGLVAELSRDYHDALKEFPDSKQENWAVEEQRGRCRQYMDELADYAARYRASLVTRQRSFFSRMMVACLSACRGGIRPAPTPLTVVEKNGNSSLSDAAARLRQFRIFFAINRRGLSALPMEAAQIAINLAKSGPVMEQAAEILYSDQKIHFERTPLPEITEFQQCQTILEHNCGTISSVIANADFTLAILTLRGEQIGREHKLALMDLVDGTLRLEFEGHEDVVTSVVGNADFSLALSASRDRRLRLWDLRSGQCRAVLAGHSAGVEAVAASADFSQAVSASWDHTLRVWDLHRCECYAVLEGHMASVGLVAVSSDFSKCISFSHDEHKLRIWDLVKLVCQCVVEVPQGAEPCTMTISPDFRLALLGGRGDRLWLWDLEKGERIATLKGHAADVITAVTSADFTRALSASQDGTLRIWDLTPSPDIDKSKWPECACLGVFEGHSDRVSAVAATPDFAQALSTSWDGTMRIWDLTQRSPRVAIDGHRKGVTSLSVSVDQNHVISCGNDGTVVLWDMECGKRSAAGTWPILPKTRLAADGSISMALTSSVCENVLRLWDLADSRCLKVLVGHTKWITSAVANAEFTLAVSGSADKTLRVWDIVNSSCLTVLEGHTDIVFAVAATSDFAKIVSVGGDRTIRIWNLITGLHRVMPCNNLVDSLSLLAVESMVISADCGRALTGGIAVALWDLDSGFCIHKLNGHASAVNAVVGSNDFRYAATGGSDCTVRLWDLATGECLACYYAASPVNSLGGAFESGRIVCGCQDGQMHFLTICRGGEIVRTRQY